MSDATSQEVEVAVEGTITRLVPCPLHAGEAPGLMITDRGAVPIGGDIPAGARVVQNPNGYHHDCPLCAKTPTQREALERTVTRHVL